jgi:hypothetical protein
MEVISNLSDKKYLRMLGEDFLQTERTTFGANKHTGGGQFVIITDETAKEIGDHLKEISKRMK